ncbi:MAG TPA: BlaI/MecI/CopY family transcriptional regulator [Solirubrobacter sp.]|nr:BlaI/MecI/CopY family transcriptional regulator [Solirubrobacter sp.]
MSEPGAIQGETQAQLMAALWRLGAGTVEQVREELPSRYQGAYTTVQTLLNRLTERGLLERTREGRGYVYRPKLTEAEYLSGSIRRTLAGASNSARQAALANIIGGLRPDELTELEELAREAREARRP